MLFDRDRDPLEMCDRLVKYRLGRSGPIVRQTETRQTPSLPRS